MKESDTATVTILVPYHVDASLPPSDLPKAQYHLSIFKPGVLWRGLVPVLLSSPKDTAERFMDCMLQESHPSNCSKAVKQQQSISKCRNSCDEKNENQNCDIGDPTDDDRPWRKRVLRLKNPSPRMSDGSIVIWLHPPRVVHPDRTFTSMLVRLENALSKLSALTAWWATLGGGYFFCRRISHSLQLARKQKALALILGNVSMARQCTVNEAYNLLYCGRFEDAKIVLKELWNSCGPDDQVTRNQCRSAWLLGKRLKRTARKLDRYRHDVSTGNSKKNLDDYQRIRLVC